MSRARRQSPEQEVTDALYEKMRGYGGAGFDLHSAVVKRVRDLIRETGDRDQVELVCLSIIDQDQENFTSVYSLGWASYEHFRERLKVPDEAWAYALWSYKVGDDPLRKSIDYWLGYWKDAESKAELERAREMLERLRDAHAIDLFEVSI